MLEKIKYVLVVDFLQFLDYLTFRTPNFYIFRVIRRFLVKKRFQNFGGKPVLGTPVSFFYTKNLKISGTVFFGENIYIEARGGVEIGDYSGVATGSYIRTESHNYEDPDIPFHSQGHAVKPVKIGRDVWIANNCFILPGTVIGDGSIIASCSVVSGNIPPYSIMAGNPARRIGVRKKSSVPAEASSDNIQP